MIRLEILKQSKYSGARLGLLHTPHGVIETPSLVPVATQAVIKTLTSDEVVQTKTQLVISNTFHLHLKPGEKRVAQSGGLHTFMQWPRPIMTDSGGFQVFSLGFGRDLNVGKVVKQIRTHNPQPIITSRTQPSQLKITPEGVFFTSPLDGSQIFIGPKESIAIQQALGADIIFAFDECTPPLAQKEYIEVSLARTHTWAKMSRDAKTSDQALFGIVQGSEYKDLRTQSAQYINSLGFDGFGIGGDLGITKEDTANILQWTIPHLDPTKPRHLLGIGYLNDMEHIIRHGVDLFDCTVPTHYGRRGVAFTSHGKINLWNAPFRDDYSLLDPDCSCQVCQKYTKGYISHLLRAGEITAMRLITFHNLFYFNTFVENLRTRIKEDQL